MFAVTYSYLPILLASLAWSIQAGKADETNGRIIGGTDVTNDSYPFMVSIQFEGRHSCGGSLIADDCVLTAAQCIYGVNTTHLSVVVGTLSISNGGVRYGVKAKFLHHSYDLATQSNDVGVIILTTKVASSNNTIALRETSVPAGEELVTLGWGLTHYPGQVPDHLQALVVQAISLEECAVRINPWPVNQGEICTFSRIGAGTCQGDSGGPLVDQSGMLVGITSFSILCAQGYPDVFQSVPFYYSWIKSQM